MAWEKKKGNGKLVMNMYEKGQTAYTIEPHAYAPSQVIEAVVTEVCMESCWLYSGGSYWHVPVKRMFPSKDMAIASAVAAPSFAPYTP